MNKCDDLYIGKYIIKKRNTTDYKNEYEIFNLDGSKFILPKSDNKFWYYDIIELNKNINYTYFLIIHYYQYNSIFKKSKNDISCKTLIIDLHCNEYYLQIKKYGK